MCFLNIPGLLSKIVAWCVFSPHQSFGMKSPNGFCSCCPRFSWFAFSRAATFPAAPLAYVAAYVFAHCVHFHVSVSSAYLSAPLAFSLDSSGCLRRHLTWWFFSGCPVAFSSAVSFLLVLVGSLRLVSAIASISVCPGSAVSWLLCCVLVACASS